MRPVVVPPDDFRSPRATSSKGVPEHAIENRVGEDTSIFRVIENGLNVTLPAPAPVLWLPIFSVCSMSKLKSSISNRVGLSGVDFDAASLKKVLNRTSSLSFVTTCDSDAR